MHRILAAAFACAFFMAASPATALTWCPQDQSYRQTCPGQNNRIQSHPRAATGTVIVGGRPAGCPRRYCGCATSLKVFGRIVPELNLAANWLRFPRTAPASGMVAARKGHVFVIKEVLGGGNVLAFDPNSGNGRTRIHVRSLAGFRVVDPHASKVAGL